MDYLIKIGKLNTIIIELKRNNAVITKLESENVKLKAKIAKLRYNINKIKQ